MRLFVALPIPDTVALRLSMLQSGVIGARWQPREQLHITLRFLGEINCSMLRDIDDMLNGIHDPPFTVELKGVGEFGHEKPHALWADVASNEALMHLQRKVERAMEQLGIVPDNHKYKPHVTLAYLRGTLPGLVMDWLTDRARFEGGAFAVKEFTLYSSQLSGTGSKYRVERVYPLG